MPTSAALGKNYLLAVTITGFAGKSSQDRYAFNSFPQ